MLQEGRQQHLCTPLACPLLVSLLLLPSLTGPTLATATADGEPTHQTLGGLTLFVNCSLLPMTGEGLRPSAWLLVRDERIAAVGLGTPPAIPAGDSRSVDCRGKFLLPGLSDARAIIGHPSELLLHLSHGVTSLLQPGGPLFELEVQGRVTDLRSLRDEILAGKRDGPRLYLAGRTLEGDPSTRRQYRLSGGAEEAARRAVQARASAGFDLIDVAPGLGPERYRAVLASAREAQLPVVGSLPSEMSGHAALGLGQAAVIGGLDLLPHDALRESKDPDQPLLARAQRLRETGGFWVPSLGYEQRKVEDQERRVDEPYGSWVDGDDLRRLAPRVRCSWQPRWTTSGDPERYRKLRGMHAEIARERYLQMRELLRLVEREGGLLLAGSYAPFRFMLPGRGLHEELDAMVEAGLSRLAALRTATQNMERFAVQHLSRQDAFGALRRGNRADLILVEGDPRQDLSVLRSPAGVMTRGRWHTRAELDQAIMRNQQAFAAEDYDCAAPGHLRGH